MSAIADIRRGHLGHRSHGQTRPHLRRTTMSVAASTPHGHPLGNGSRSRPPGTTNRASALPLVRPARKRDVSTDEPPQTPHGRRTAGGSPSCAASVGEPSGSLGRTVRGCDGCHRGAMTPAPLGFPRHGRTVLRVGAVRRHPHPCGSSQVSSRLCCGCRRSLVRRSPPVLTLRALLARE